MRKLTLSLAVMAALLPTHVFSLGLGDMELNSALNQELNAEIEILSAAPEDAEQLIVKLADRNAFNRAGLDRPHVLQQLRFKIIVKSGVPYITVFTRAPIREPYLSFLVEIDWPQGHLLREYTLLLDPPIYNNAPASPAAATTGTDSHPFIDSTGSAQNQPTVSEQHAQTTHSTAQNTQTAVLSDSSGRTVAYQAQALPVAAVNSNGTGEYRVQSNDTLWGLASRMRPDSSVSVEQMMLALVRKNPEAFIRENINGVKRGYILRTPNRDEATQITRQEAIAEVREHTALWREYSHNAVSASPASSLENDDAGTTAADQPRDVDGHLSIVGASQNEGSDHAGANQDPNSQLSNLKQDLAIAREELESARLEKDDLQSRLAELEARVQRVIEMDDSELAQLQADLTQTKQPAETEVAPANELTEEMVETSEPQENTVVEELESQDEIAVDEDAVAEESIDEPADDELFVDELNKDEVAEQTELDASTEELPDNTIENIVENIEPPVFAQQNSQSFLEKLSNDPKLLGIIGGGLAFLFLLIALLLKRLRGKAGDEEQWAASIDGESDKPADVASFESNNEIPDESATVKMDSVDMNATAEMEADTADALGVDDTQIEAPGADLEDTVFSLDDNTDNEPEEVEQDDVLAEADVYLAYGIYQQAEELLIGAIDQNPERDDYRMKLLETHFAAKNASGFEQLAEDVKARKSDDEAYWGRVTAMGIELCPTSALFSGLDASIADFDPDGLLPDKPQTTDFELDDAEDDASADFDLGLDDEATQILSKPTELDASDGDMGGDLDLVDELEDLANELDGDLGDLGDLDDSLDGDLGDFDDSLEGDLEELIENDSDTADITDISEDLSADLGELSNEVSDDMSELTIDSDETAADLDIDDDFSLDFDASDLGFEESEDEISESEDITLDADLELDEGLDDIGEINIDSAELGLDESGLDDSGSDESSELDDIELDLDESDISIDIDETDESAVDTATDLDASLDLSDDGDFDISELSDDIDEVSTKLELAKAYIDMGDKDGAISILEEVKSEGNEEQQKQAEELIQQAS